jgi:aryl-alcohol dehydrogenase-like predicted oxidoreductase
MKGLSKIGVGLYQGEESDAGDLKLFEVLEFALLNGVHVFDCAPSYRNRRSENVLGRLTQRYPDRDYFISTKGGFVPFDFSQGEEKENAYVQELFDRGWVRPSHFDQEYFQTFDPIFLEQALITTLTTLSRDSIELYYLHNPEYFLAKVGRVRFLEVMKEVLLWIKDKIEAGQIKAFGISSWNGFFEEEQRNRLELLEFYTLAEEVGIQSYFNYLQVPYNFSQTKGLFFKGQKLGASQKSLFGVAEELKLSILGSAPLGQGKLPKYAYPEKVQKIFPGMTSAQISLSFVLSTPGISSALIGTTSLVHFKELVSVYLEERFGDRYFIETLTQ